MESEKKQLNIKNKIFYVLFVVVVVALIVVFMGYRNVNDKLNLLTTPEGQEKLQKEEVDKLVESVGKHILLPQDETPTIATITDSAKLAEQESFYKDAQNGDKILLYLQNKKAIIYSIEKDILINVGPVFTDSDNK